MLTLVLLIISLKGLIKVSIKIIIFVKDAMILIRSTANIHSIALEQIELTISHIT